MFRQRHLAGLVVLLLVLAALPASAQDDGQNPLLNLLSYVPDTESNREFITYGDFATWNQSWEFIRIGSVAQLELRSNLNDPVVPATLFTMPRQTGAPQVLGLDTLLHDDLHGYLGFDLFSTNRFLEAGQPPQMLNVLETSAADDAIAAALETSEYTASALGEATLHSKGEDNQTTLAADAPMQVRLGALNRVALLDDVVLIGRATAIIEAAVSTASGNQPSLADNATYSAGALAVSDPAYAGAGALVGAMFMGQAEPLDAVRVLGPRATPEQVAALTASLDLTGELPAYELAVFGTRRRDDDSQLLLALVFPEGVDAQAAADTLMMRMKTYDSIRTRQPIVDVWAEHGVTMEWGRGVDVGGVPVALVSLSARNPTLREGDSGQVESAVFSWQNMVYILDLGFMIPG